MADTRPTATDTLHQQVSTTDVTPAGYPAAPVDGFAPRSADAPGSADQPPAGEPQDSEELEQQVDQKEMQPGIGLEGEFVVWEGRYSFKNFMGRMLLRGLASLAWVALAYYAWGRGDAVEPVWGMLAIGVGVVVLLWWLHLGWQVLYARMSHYYKLSNKRLFVWTGVFRRRVDQLELLRINDVYVNHNTLAARLLNVGTVVVESSEEQMPTTYLVGVDEPEKVMDTVWHTSRAEREGHSVRVDQV
jgi:hypothetical protein